MIKRLLILLILLIAVPCFGADYPVSTVTGSVNGQTFCDGNPCTSADTIIITGGARGDLQLINFDGDGEYITVINEDSATRVTITYVGTYFGGIQINNSSWIDVRGDGYSGNDWVSGCSDASCYGIVVTTTGDIPNSAMIASVGDCDNIKISYIEVDGSNDTSEGESGIIVGSKSLDDSSTLSDWEVHHNYVHGVPYAGMYFGNNDPPGEYNPYLADFLIHDNLLEDLGGYGITYKGIKTGSVGSLIYNNIIRASNRSSGASTGLVTTEDDGFKHGIGVAWAYGTAYVKIYDNWIEKTVGPGLKISESPHLIYDNKILGCGTGDDLKWGHGIYVQTYNTPYSQDVDTIQIYDNIIIEPTRYGVSDYNGQSSSRNPTAVLQRNIIAEAGIGEFQNVYGEVTEGTGVNANVTTVDADNICFTTWSDDSDYSNDDFTLCCDYDYTSIAANACGATTTPVSGVKFNGAEYN